MSGPHASVVHNHAMERLQFLDVGWRLHPQNCIDLLAPRFDTIGHQPMTKEVHFLDSPFALERIDGKPLVLENCQDLVKETQMFFPGTRGGTKVIQADLQIFEVPKNLFHDFLGNVRRSADSQRQTSTTKWTKGCCNHAEFLALNFELKGAVLH